MIATGDIRRDAILHIAALRLLTAGPDKSKTEKCAAISWVLR